MKNKLYIVASLIVFLLNYAARGQRKTEDFKVLMLCSDTSKPNSLFTLTGYSRKEKHSTAEGIIDPGGRSCVDNNGNIVPCYSDYWKNLIYLDAKRKPLSKKIHVCGKTSFLNSSL